MKHTENMGHCERTKFINNRKRGRRRNSDQRQIKYFQQIQRHKFPQTKERGQHDCVHQKMHTAHETD